MKSLLLALALTTAAVSGAPRPFFVFDNGLNTAPLRSFAAKFELIKQTGFDGLSWRTDTPERIRELIDVTRTNGLKTFAVYVQLELKDGKLVHSPQVAQLIDDFKGTDTIIWVGNANVRGHSPSVNASLPPGLWQSFDIVFRAPRFDSAGRKTANARFVKVVHNGKTVHENIELLGPTRGGTMEAASGPLRLQGDHGVVAFRNVRIKPLDSGFTSN